MSEEEQTIIRCFTQCSNMLLYGLPQLPILDKWALITLMGLCWDRSQTGKSFEEIEGPYKLSLREISNITGVDHTSLRTKHGKNPREGVLDRLERFGYVSIREGRPIDEYTGTLGREQTYLYIHLAHIWEENNCFADAWRVPQNRLVREELIEFTVGVVNSHVDDINSSVDDANSHVDQDNHTVDGASTKYVLRQCNTKKKTIEDNGNTFASDDATHTLLSQEELIKKSLSFIAEKGEVTLYDLEQYLQSFIKVKGERNVFLVKYKNAIIWDNISVEFCEVFMGIQSSKQVELEFGSEKMYRKKQRPDMPIATELEDHEKKEWHPMYFKSISDNPF